MFHQPYICMLTSTRFRLSRINCVLFGSYLCVHFVPSLVTEKRWVWRNICENTGKKWHWEEALSFEVAELCMKKHRKPMKRQHLVLFCLVGVFLLCYEMFDIFFACFNFRNHLILPWFKAPLFCLYILFNWKYVQKQLIASVELMRFSFFSLLFLEEGWK